MGNMGQRALFRSDGNALKLRGCDACRALQTHRRHPAGRSQRANVGAQAFLPQQSRFPEGATQFLLDKSKP